MAIGLTTAAALAAAGLGGVGLGMGASGGGGFDILSGIEIGTTKKQETLSYQTTENIQETWNISPVTTRTYDIQYNIASGGSSVSTKKEQAIEQTPSTNVVPETYIIPQIIPLMTQGAGAESSAPMGSGGTASGGGINFAQILLIAGIGLGIYYLFFQEDSK